MSDQPNVLIILSDQHNKAVMGCAGDKIVRTPNLDRLAEEGMLFSNAYTPAPLCVPARMSFMTSKLPSNNRIWHNHAIMSSGSLTWPHLLAPAGYESALIGRMHFEGAEQKHGFEKRPLAEPRSAYPGTRSIAGFYEDGVPAGSGQNRKVMEKTGGKGKGVYEIFDEKVTEETCKYLKEKAAGNQSRPFAAVAGYLLPHCPFIGNPEMYDYYYERLPDAEVTQEYLDSLPETVKRNLGSRGLEIPLSKDRVRACQAAYYAMVESMDKLIGKILETLDETGLSENTMVIYTSDHGEMMNSHGCWTKSCYYEGSVGIPMVVRCPGIVPERTVCPEAVSLIDLGPTVLEFAGSDPLPYADGKSLLSLLRGEKLSEDRVVISELYDTVHQVGSAMVRKGPWKYWTTGDDAPDILFNLTEDAAEEINRAEAEDSDLIINELKAELNKVCDFDAMIKEAAKQHIEYKAISMWGRITEPFVPGAVDIARAGQSFELG